MAIWAQSRYLVGFLVLVILGHWSLILQGNFMAHPVLHFIESDSLAGSQLKAAWVPGVGCAITQTNTRIQSAIFIYSMCFDLIVLLLNTYKLGGIHSPSQSMLGKSRLAKLIFTDGLIYFILACVIIHAYSESSPV
jgi:hypothetical protein